MSGLFTRRPSKPCSNCETLAANVEELKQTLKKTYDEFQKSQTEFRQQIESMKLELKVKQAELKTRDQQAELERGRAAGLRQQLKISRIYQQVAVSTCADLEREKRELRTRSCMIVDKLLSMPGQVGVAASALVDSGGVDDGLLSPSLINVIEELIGDDDADQDDCSPTGGNESPVRRRKPSLPTEPQLTEHMLQVVRQSFVENCQSKEPKRNNRNEEEDDNFSLEVPTKQQQEQEQDEVYEVFDQESPKPKPTQSESEQQQLHLEDEENDVYEEAEISLTEASPEPKPRLSESQQQQPEEEPQKEEQDEVFEKAEISVTEASPKPKPRLSESQQQQQSKPPKLPKPILRQASRRQAGGERKDLSLVPESEEETDRLGENEATIHLGEENQEENADIRIELATNNTEQLENIGTIDDMLEALRQASQTAIQRECGCDRQLDLAVTALLRVKRDAEEHKRQLRDLDDQINELKIKASRPPPPPIAPPPPPPPTPPPTPSFLNKYNIGKKNRNQLAKVSSFDETLIESLKNELKAKLSGGCKVLRPTVPRHTPPSAVATTAAAGGDSEVDEQLKKRMAKIRHRLSSYRPAPVDEPRAIFMDRL